MLLVCPILDVKATNYNVSVSDNIQSNEYASQKFIIDEKDKQIAFLESVETLSLAVGVGGIASGIGLSIFFEIRRGKNHRVLTDLILNGNNKILNAINGKKDEKQTSKVNGSMNLDFSSFLLRYAERFFMKKTDIANLSIIIIALIVSMATLLITSIIKTQGGIVIINVGLATLSGLIIYIVYELKYKLKNNNDLVLQIEEIIISKYDFINGRPENKKIEILKQINVVLRKKTTENMKDLEKLLSNPET